MCKKADPTGHRDQWHASDPEAVLAEAFANAAKYLGLAQSDLGTNIGKDHSRISRGCIAPQSKAGELTKLFIRGYRELRVQVHGHLPPSPRHRSSDLFPSNTEPFAEAEQRHDAEHSKDSSR